MTDRLRGAVVLAFAVLGAAACGTTAGPDAGRPVQSPPVVADPTAGEPGRRLDVAPPPPPVAWADDGRRLTVTTWGSSSCPTEPTGVEVVGPQEVHVQIEPLFPDRDPCTADMAVLSYDVDVPPDISPDEALTVHLRYEDGSEQTVLLAPAGR